MNSILRRRRALMNQWEDITSQLSFYNWTGVDHEISGNDIRVFTTSDGTVRAIRANFTTNEAYKYKFTCDSVTVISGAGRIACRNSSATIQVSSPIWVVSQGPVDKEFEHNASIAMLSLFCTVSTSAAGNVTYHNFRLWRKKL